MSLEGLSLALSMKIRKVLVYVSTAVPIATAAAKQYVPRSRNELHTIFEHHFTDFCDQYDEKYSASYGMYRLERIQQIGERFVTLVEQTADKS